MEKASIHATIKCCCSADIKARKETGVGDSKDVHFYGVTSHT